MSRRPRVAAGDKRGRFALAAEAKIFKPVDGQVRECIVDHDVVDIAVADARVAHGVRPGDTECAGGAQILHLADHGGFRAFAGAEDVHGLLREVPGPLRPGQDQGAAAVRDEAAFEQVERIGDHARCQHVLHRDRVAIGCAGVAPRPLPLDNGHHGELLMGQTVLLHVAQDGDGEHRRRSHGAVGIFELLRQPRGPGSAPSSADLRPTALSMRDQDSFGLPGLNRSHRVPHMEHEGATAHTGPVDPARRDSQVVDDFDRR